MNYVLIAFRVNLSHMISVQRAIVLKFRDSRVRVRLIVLIEQQIVNDLQARQTSFIEDEAIEFGRW